MGITITCAQAHKIAFLGAGSQTVELYTDGKHPPGWISVAFEDRRIVLDERGNVIA